MPTTVGISFFKSSPEEGLSYKVKKDTLIIVIFNVSFYLLGQGPVWQKENLDI